MTKSTEIIAAAAIIAAIFSGVVSTTNDGVQSPEEVEAWFEKFTRSNPPEKMTKLHFYARDMIKGTNVTSAMVAQANMTARSPTFFGNFIIADDPLTIAPALSSKHIGYIRGFYGGAGMEEVALAVAMTFVFTDGELNGSTLAVLGHNPDRRKYRELPIVGGTGVFRLARGISTWQTYYYDVAAGNATLEISVTVLHY
ncbi:dirigent protein 22-like [Andrographis paniculata]|uniref:dirigent protein 22-like n=1 Tax=Andrographis paniculata TaxID=175694 RepID=UPI0021E865FF|nr:dirigent protein 22-like [Andrographis paniculata]